MNDLNFVDASSTTDLYTLIVNGTSFKLSSTLLSSDDPNYFTYMFSNMKSKTLYIDRDPEIFKDIVKHLQGYCIIPRDEIHFADLFADAMYYNLTKLITHLRSVCIVNVGGKVFRLEKELFGKRDAPNFFTSMGFGHGWEPPLGIPLVPFVPSVPTMPPTTLDRDPDTFSDIVRYLRGYEITVKDEVHRQNLLNDARFYRLKGLVEKLHTSSITVNGFAKGENNQNEILFRLTDVRPANVILSDDDNNPLASLTPIKYKSREGTICVLLVEVYNFNLICEYGSVTTPLTLGQKSFVQPTIGLVFNEKYIQKLKAIAKTLKLSETIDFTAQSPESCAFEIDGSKTTFEALSNFERLGPLVRSNEFGKRYLRLYVSRSILRLFSKQGQVELHLVKCEAFSSERGFNAKREFLSADTGVTL